MVDYFEEFDSATPDLTQRAVGVNLPGGTTVAAGASVDGEPVVAGLHAR